MDAVPREEVLFKPFTRGVLPSCSGEEVPTGETLLAGYLPENGSYSRGIVVPHEDPLLVDIRASVTFRRSGEDYLHAWHLPTNHHEEALHLIVELYLGESTTETLVRTE